MLTDKQKLLISRVVAKLGTAPFDMDVRGLISELHVMDAKLLIAKEALRAIHDSTKGAYDMGEIARSALPKIQ